MVDRLFQMVYLLMERPQITAKELAQMFEVSERTIYRDIDKLTLAGIPIYTNQGKNGGISILPNYVLNKAVLTTEEKNKILDSLNALNELEPSQDTDTASKLQTFFGDEYQEWIEVDFSTWGNSEKDKKVFEQMKRAIHTHQYMEIIYSGNGGALIKRTIKPLKLCFKNQAWYLYAYCCLREDYRFFKLRRISEITALESYFKPEYIGKVLTDVSIESDKSDAAIQVVLEINQDMAFWAFDELPGISVLENHKLCCTVEVKDLEWFISYVLSYGSYMQVLEPAWVKEKVVKEIKKMQEIYEEKRES